MTYRTKILWGSSEFHLNGDSIVITEKRGLWQRAVHRIPKISLSAGSGWIEQRDRGITSAIQIAGLFAFMAVIFLSVLVEHAGWVLWSGIVVTLSIMIAAPLFAPIQRVFVAYAASGQPAFAISERRDARGKREFQAFVETYENWVGKRPEADANEPVR